MSPNSITTRWIDGPTASQAEWDLIDERLAARGWMSINRMTSRVLVAEREGKIIGFHVFQLVPYCGPLHVDREFRGTGLAAELADQMMRFLVDTNARGWIASTESPYAERLCKDRGMEKLATPVYVMMDPGGVNI